MAAKHWLIGCGIGCGVIVLLVVGLGVAGGVWLKSATSGFENAVQTRDDLDERFGEPGEFTPLASGAVPAERMESFVAVREATQEQRRKLAETFGGLPLSEEKARELEEQEGMEKARSVFGILGSAFGLIGGIGDFCEARNRAMLEADMGMGEYSYIYVLAYRSWLGHTSDGLHDHEGRPGDVQVDLDDFDLPSSVHDQLIEMLDNQLRSLPADADPEWRAALSAELEALNRDRERWAWEDGLPEAIAASFAPYRERLVATYEPLASDFELIRNRKKHAFSYTTD